MRTDSDDAAPAVSWDQAHGLAEEFGASYYLIDTDRIAAAVEALDSSFNAVHPTSIAYAYKANNLPALCAHMKSLGLLAETASDLEWWLARRLDVPTQRIVSNGLHRSEQSLREAILGGALVNLHTAQDLQTALELAGRTDRELAVGLRCRVPLRDGSPSRLGFSPEDATQAAATLRRTPGIRLAGLHAHTPGHDVDTLAQRAQMLVELSGALFSEVPDYLDIGGGFYGGVPPRDDAPDARDYAAAVTSPLREAYGTGGPRLILEPGTSLIAPAVSYVTKVLAVDGTTATVAGSLLHTSPNTRRTNFPVTVLRQSPSAQTGGFDVVGSTLIEGEYLAFDVPGPLTPGDFLVFGNVGAYSVGGMTPAFLLPIPAVLARREGQWQVWRPPQTPEDVFAGVLPPDA